MNLYVTADKIGTWTGGGTVTKNESEALKTLGDCAIWERERLSGGSDPWGWDEVAVRAIEKWHFDLRDDDYPKLAHFYAGSFGRTVEYLRYNGCRVVYTIAAHDRRISREEHEKLGLQFPYPHLVQEELWQRYIEGYRLADIIVCPGSIPAETVRNYGPDFANKRIEIIPHGCTIPEEVKPLPKKFTVGYLGADGPDKGLRYLIEAWGRLNYSDATLVLAGISSTSPFVRWMISEFGGNANFRLLGWVNNVSDFYNQISLYVQPSASEGFGCEVLEAMAHGRPVVCSHGAGARDVLQDSSAGILVQPCNVDELAGTIDNYHCRPDIASFGGENGREQAKEYTWDKIRQRYVNLWKSLL